MKTYLLIVLMFVISIFTSCVNTNKFGTVRISKNQKIYFNYDSTDNQPPTHNLVTLTTKKWTTAQIQEKDDQLKVKFIGFAELKRDTTNLTPPGNDYYYFPYPDDSTRNEKFKYVEMTPVFQAISTPFKIRPRLNDSTPYQVTTSVNLGLSYGWKYTHNTYRNYYDTKGSFLNKRTTSFSITPAFFIGPTTVSLNSKNTNGEIADDFKVLGINTGLMLVAGINKFNIGVSTGLDFGFGGEAKNWIYQGKPWIGFVIGIDFIK